MLLLYCSFLFSFIQIFVPFQMANLLGDVNKEEQEEEMPKLSARKAFYDFILVSCESEVRRHSL